MLSNRAIHLNLTNQREEWVEDQILFLKHWTTQNHFDFSYSDELKSGAMNFLFDGANITKAEKDRLVLEKIQTFLIATEHVSNKGGFHYNGLHWSKEFDASIDRFTSRRRLSQLINLSEHCEAILILGDLPDAEDYRESFPNKLVFNLEYPLLGDENEMVAKKIEYDAIFTAPTPYSLTDYRDEIIEKLITKGNRIHTEFGMNFEEFQFLANKTNSILHIPKSQSWVWPSPMRIFRAAISDLNFVSVEFKVTYDHQSILEPLVTAFSDTLEAVDFTAKPSMRKRYNNLVNSEINIALGVKWHEYLKATVEDSYL